jgi:hypothetical protein
MTGGWVAILSVLAALGGQGDAHAVCEPCLGSIDEQLLAQYHFSGSERSREELRNALCQSTTTQNLTTGQYWLSFTTPTGGTVSVPLGGAAERERSEAVKVAACKTGGQLSRRDYRWLFLVIANDAALAEWQQCVMAKCGDQGDHLVVTVTAKGSNRSAIRVASDEPPTVANPVVQEVVAVGDGVTCEPRTIRPGEKIPEEGLVQTCAWSPGATGPARLALVATRVNAFHWLPLPFLDDVFITDVVSVPLPATVSP